MLRLREFFLFYETILYLIEIILPKPKAKTFLCNTIYHDYMEIIFLLLRNFSPIDRIASISFEAKYFFFLKSKRLPYQNTLNLIKTGTCSKQHSPCYYKSY